MKYPLPSGLTQGLPFIIPGDWTPEQAQAIVELLDDFRDRIWARYQIPLHDLYQQQLPFPEDDFMRPTGNEPPF